MLQLWLGVSPLQGHSCMHTPLPGVALPQRPHVAAQKAPATMKSSPHLPQAACCAQVKPPEGATSAQAASRNENLSAELWQWR